MLQTRLILALACLPLAQAGVTSLTVPLTGNLGAIQLSGFVHTVSETTSPSDPCRFHANLAGVQASETAGRRSSASERSPTRPTRVSAAASS